MIESIKIKLFTDLNADIFEIEDPDIGVDKTLEWFKDMWKDGKRITLSNKNKISSGYDLSKYKAFVVEKC